MAMAVTYETFDGVLLSENRGGSVTEYFGDPLRSLVRTEDSTGAVTSTATYWPYGELRTSTGRNPTPWGFVGLLGYFTDSVSRLYVRMRHYRPDTTRWMTVDRLWPRLPSYDYVQQLPIVNYDPLGLFRSGPSKGGYFPRLTIDDDLVFTYGNYCGQRNYKTGCDRPPPYDLH